MTHGPTGGTRTEPHASRGAGALAVVIGRAGSKGLPRKNALPVAGVPMIAHTIRFARASSCIARVIVSTDGEEIAEIARGEGVEVVLRPEALANDTATVDAAVRHAVTAAESDAEIVVILYGNVPVRPADLADRAVARLVESGADSVQSFYRVGKTHPYWMSRLDGEGRISQFIENRVFRRQDLPPLFMLDGGIIAVRRASLFEVREGEPHAFLGRDRRGIETREGEVVDVDSAIDLAVAEAILGSGREVHA
jgi:CMP-N,N'-diacetyllegionaminic acid synthase